MVWRFLKKLNIELLYDPAIPLLDTYLEKMIIQKDTCTPVFTAAIFTVAKTRKKPKSPSTEEWIKIWCIYTVECVMVICVVDYRTRNDSNITYLCIYKTPYHEA